MLFKTDKKFVTKVALLGFAPPQLLRQFCPFGRTVFAVQPVVMRTPALGRKEKK
jgi:hypothetical protein